MHHIYIAGAVLSIYTNTAVVDQYGGDRAAKLYPDTVAVRISEQQRVPAACVKSRASLCSDNGTEHVYDSGACTVLGR